MIFPELPLSLRGDRSLRCTLGVLVKGKRVVLEHDLDIFTVRVEDLLEGLSGIMRPQAKAVDVTLELQIDDELPSLQTDPGKLQQILYNYLSNAIKFAPSDSVVTISAIKVTLKDDSTSVNISIRDSLEM